MGTRLSKAYLLTKVLTASNQEVIVYLYEGAISYLHRAINALRENQRAAADTAIKRCISILVELSGNLNYSVNSHLALKLDAIYTYLIQTLSLAGDRGDTHDLASCEGILATLYDAWQQATTLDKKAAPRPDHRVHVLA